MNVLIGGGLLLGGIAIGWGLRAAARWVRKTQREVDASIKEINGVTAEANQFLAEMKARADNVRRAVAAALAE